MTLTLDLPPEIESRLLAAAARHGQDVKTFAVAALADVALADIPLSDAALTPSTNGATHSSLSEAELDAALDELAAIGDVVPAPTEHVTHDRADIYLDHD